MVLLQQPTVGRSAPGGGAWAKPPCHGTDAEPGGEFAVVISVQGVSKFLAKSEIFQDVSFHINEGERIGLIGRNGVGKTTLFQVLLRETEPDTGIVTIPKYVAVGSLPQQMVCLSGKSVLARAMDVSERLRAIQGSLHLVQDSLEGEQDPQRTRALVLEQAHLLEQFELLGGYDLEARARKILAGLGFAERRLAQPVEALSGGWMMRLALARLLLAAPDVLLLDEPTNHLDLDSLLWLEQYLLTSRLAMIIISHDRVFLNRLVGRILELEQGKLHEYAGNYDRYLEEKALRQEIQLASYRNQRERIQQIERFIARNRYRKSKARQAQSRLKLMDKIELLDAPDEQANIQFSFPEPSRSGKRVIELRNLSKTYDDLRVYENLDLVLERGDRVAFLGPNGAGKSTLLKMIAGVAQPTAGELVIGHQVVTGYYAQHQMEQLHPQLTVLQEVSRVSGDLTLTRIRGLLGAFLFRGEDVEKRVAVLSGGEKARLVLCKLLLQRPNLLLLDEPTNHLDIPAREVFEEALEGFTGTICFISHDRHFINTIANKILLVDGGKAQLLQGNYDDYQNIWQERLKDEEPQVFGLKPSQPKVEESPPAARKVQERKRQEAAWRNEFYRIRRPLQERLETIEASMDQTHQRVDSLNALLADSNTYQNGTDVAALQKEYQQLKKTLQTLTADWEEQALALEELENDFWEDKKP
jgi:ATP-binding cassette, subfamily F, member 3